MVLEDKSVQKLTWFVSCINWLKYRPLVPPLLMLCGVLVGLQTGVFWWLGATLLGFVLCCLVGRWILLVGILSSLVIGYLHDSRINHLKNAGTAVDSKKSELATFLIRQDKGNGRFVASIEQSSRFRKGTRCMLDVRGALEKGEPVELEMGDVVNGNFVFSLPFEKRNHGGFDERSWLSSIQIPIKASGVAEKVDTNPAFTFLSLFPKAKAFLKKRLAMGIEDANSVKVIQSMFLGERFGNDDPVAHEFRISGAMHVFAVSGLHVMLVGGLLLFVFRFIPVPRSLVVIIVIVMMVVYTGITGWGTPAVRATVMAAVLLSGGIFYRKANILNSMAASSFLVLALDSYQLFTVGFQLTYGVVIAIALFTKFWERRLVFMSKSDDFIPFILLGRSKRLSLWTRKYLSQSLAVSFAAWMGSAPLIAFYFKIISPVALAINVPVVLLLTVILWLGLISIAVGSLWAPAGKAVNSLNGLAAQFAYRLAKGASDLKYGHFTFSNQAKESVEVLDVGGGGAVYVNLGSGLLIDMGGRRTGLELSNVLREFSRSLDTVVVSHLDAEHISGYKLVFKEYKIAKAIIPSEDVSYLSYREWAAALKANTVPVEVVKKGKLIDLDSNKKIEVLYNGADMNASATDDRGLVLRLSWDEGSILFMNDAGFETERHLIDTGVNLKADILVVGKHEDQDGTSLDFINLVTPKAIIATGVTTNHSFLWNELRMHKWKEGILQKGIPLFLQSKTGGVSITMHDKAFLLDSVIQGEKSARIPLN
jgi:competence protein ComEC